MLGGDSIKADNSSLLPSFFSSNMKLAISLLLLVELCVSYKVLVFNPAFGASHSNFLGKISDILIDAGHEVTMFIPVFVHGKKHLVGSKKVKNIVKLEQDPRIRKMHQESASEEIMRKRIWKMDSDITAMLSFMRNFSLTAAYQAQCKSSMLSLYHFIICYKLQTCSNKPI